MLDLINFKDYVLLVFYFFYAVLLPGYLLARFMVPPKQLKALLGTLPNLEKNLVYRYFYYLFAPATGLILVDATVLILAKLNQSFSFSNFFIGFSTINILLLILNVWFLRLPKKPDSNKNKTLNSVFVSTFVLLFLGSVFIRTVFYLPDVVPQDTDLGHHMYWSQLMVQTEKFPVYDTPEVIEGEHMIFAVLSKLSGITLLSAMPLIVISFYNLAMLLALSFTALVITSNRKIALWTLFFTGIYFAIDPPQARYVKGGVIGNTFGNLFIPLVFLLVFLFFRWWFERYSRVRETVPHSFKAISSIISLILVLIAGSFYTHHLSTFLLGITLIFSLVAWIIIILTPNKNEYFFSRKDVIKALSSFLYKVVFSLKFITTLLIIIAFPLFIYIPHYLANNAVQTVTQAPEKSTHLGVTLTDFIGKMGITRSALIVFAVLFLLLIIAVSLVSRYGKKESLLPKTFSNVASYFTSSTNLLYLLLSGWFLPLALLSFYPQLFKVDLPSRRVINYLVFPGILLAAVAAEMVFKKLTKTLRGKIALAVFAFLSLAIVYDGTGDFRSVYSGNNKFQEAVELYNSSQYLADNTPKQAVILKDHRTVVGDSWIKFFLLRGYDYLISRTYDYKYNAVGNNLDPCTRETILVPESSLAQRCYGQTGINYVIVKPAGDEYLFWKGRNFDTIYINDNIAIFRVLNVSLQSSRFLE